MVQKRRAKRTFRLNRGENDIDQILKIEGVLSALEYEVEAIRKDTSREELKVLRTKIMKLCNPHRQGIAQTQRIKAEELRDEFHRKLSHFGIARWWQRYDGKSTNRC